MLRCLLLALYHCSSFWGFEKKNISLNWWPSKIRVEGSAAGLPRIIWFFLLLKLKTVNNLLRRTWYLYITWFTLRSAVVCRRRGCGRGTRRGWGRPPPRPAGAGHGAGGWQSPPGGDQTLQEDFLIFSIFYHDSAYILDDCPVTLFECQMKAGRGLLWSAAESWLRTAQFLCTANTAWLYSCTPVILSSYTLHSVQSVHQCQDTHNIKRLI